MDDDECESVAQVWDCPASEVSGTVLFHGLLHLRVLNFNPFNECCNNTSPAQHLKLFKFIYNTNKV